MNQARLFIAAIDVLIVLAGGSALGTVGGAAVGGVIAHEDGKPKK